MNDVKYSEEIEKVINRKNTECALYNSLECKVLNQGSCSECAVGRLRREKQEAMKKAIGRLESIAPSSELEKLADSSECLFCKAPEKGKRECYGVFDLAKQDDEGDWVSHMAKKGNALKSGCMILPIQAACCDKCRKRFRLLSYLPQSVMLGIICVGLITITRTEVHKALYNTAAWLPAAAMLAVVAAAFAIRFVMRKAMKHSFGKSTNLDLSQIPGIKSLLDRGFVEVKPKTDGLSSVAFSRERRTTGVGTYSPSREQSGDSGEEPHLMGIWPMENAAEKNDGNAMSEHE